MSRTQRTYRIRWASIGRLALAHHPRCFPFRNDVYRVGRVELCIGCYTAYPIAVALLGLLALAHPPVWWAWLVGGMAIGSLQFLSVAGWTRTRRRKVWTKVALGVGLALTVYGILLAPWSWGWRVAALVVGSLLATAAMLPRSLRMRDTCRSCFYQGDWERCVGMALIKPPKPPTAQPAGGPNPAAA